MAQGTGSTKPIIGLNQTFGGLFWAPIDYSGSQSYVQGGDSISPQSFGFNSTIWDLLTGVDQSGKWQVESRPLNNGVTQWQLVWIALVTATLGGQAQTAGQEAVAGTNLSTFTIRLSAHGQ
jgi:hypothetical protein